MAICTASVPRAWPRAHVAPEAQSTHAVLRQLAQARHTLALPLAEAADRLVSGEGWKKFGYANAQDFARERLERSGRWLKDLSKLHRACLQHPALRLAVAGLSPGPALGSVAALEIARVATAADIDQWIARARRVNIRDLKKQVRAAKRRHRGRDGAPHGPDVSEKVHSATRAHLPVPGFVLRAFLDLEDVHQSANGAVPRSDYVDALVAEWRGRFSDGDGSESGAPAAFPRGVVRLRRSSRVSPARLTKSAEARRNESAEVEPPTTATGLKSLWTLERLRRYLESSGARPGSQSRIGSLRTALKRLQDLLQLENEIEIRIADLLLYLDDRNWWKALGYENATHYGEACLGVSPSTTRARLRLARARQSIPELRQACESGFVGPQRALRVARVLMPKHSGQAARVDPALTADWVEHAGRVTVKRLDDELRFIDKRAAGQAKAGPGRPLSDEEWRSSIRRSPGDAHTQLAADSIVGLKKLTKERVAADVFLRLYLDTESMDAFLTCIESARREVAAVARSAAPSSAAEARWRPSVRMARAFLAWRSGVPAWIGLLAMLEEYAEHNDNPRRMTKRPTDRICSRDGWRCTAPGCTARAVEVHHLEYLSRGGSDDDSNLTCLCPFHHRMGEHGDLARVRGAAPLGLEWRLGRKDLAVQFRNESHSSAGKGSA